MISTIAPVARLVQPGSKRVVDPLVRRAALRVRERLVRAHRIVHDGNIAAPALGCAANAGGDHLASLVVHELCDLVPIAFQAELVAHILRYQPLWSRLRRTTECSVDKSRL